MPNISFDIFFDQDFINVTATRGKTAPKAKPEWKVRSAPKLPPKEQPVDHSGAVRPPQRPKINEGRGQVGKPPQQEEKALQVNSDSTPEGGEKARRKPPKLGPKKSAPVTNAVSSAGGFAGGAVNSVGNSINSVGDTVGRSIRSYGDGAKDYGNSIMDWTSATGVRSATAQNPLGLSGNTAAGKRAVTSPAIYYPSSPVVTKPKPEAAKQITSTPKKVTPAPAKKVTNAGAPKPITSAKTSTPAKTPVTANSGAIRKPAQGTAGGGVKKTVSAASKPAPKTVNKPTAAPAKPRAPTAAARNPLGLTGDQKK